jgi:hypothetical protein
VSFATELNGGASFSFSDRNSLRIPSNSVEPRERRGRNSSAEGTNTSSLTLFSMRHIEKSHNPLARIKSLKFVVTPLRSAGKGTIVLQPSAENESIFFSVAAEFGVAPPQDPFQSAEFRQCC